MITDALKTMKVPCSSGRSGTLQSLIGEVAEAGPGVDGLDGDGTADDAADLQEDHGHGGQQRVGHGVLAAHVGVGADPWRGR